MLVNKFVARAIYDFSVDGGTSGAITLADTTMIPDNAVVSNVIIHSPTAVTSAGAATVAVTAGGVTVSAAIGKANLDDNQVQSDSTGGKATSAANIGVTVGTADTTAGYLIIYVEYFLEGATPA